MEGAAVTVTNDPGTVSLNRTPAGLLETGTLLQDRYQVMEILGVGGFSSVYQARDLRFTDVTRLCAIKEMTHRESSEKSHVLAASSFQREASILATLSHPAVPDVYDFFTESERSYLVLECIAGKDLEAIIEERTKPHSIKTILDWAIQLCDVLAYLHGHEPVPVMFRDLKPSNIMVDPRGRIRLIDFNIAKSFQGDKKGTTIGTEGYSPPEQYRGVANPSGDIYALGATLHHLLTLQDPRDEAPFSFPDRPILEFYPDAPKTLVAIIERCLAYEAADRFQDALSLREALNDVYSEIGPMPITAVSASTKRRAISEQPVSVRKHDSEGPEPLWAFKCEDELRSCATVAMGMVFVGAYDNNLYAIKTDNGQFVWKYATSDSIASTPYIYNNSVFVGSADNRLYSLHPGSGRLNWQFATEGPIFSSPKADYGHVFFGSDDGHLYAVNVANGRKVWKVEAHSIVRSTPCIAEERIYFGTEGGYLFCVDLAGRLIWQFQAKRSITSSPATEEDLIFVGSMDATVYAIDAGSGWAIWRFRAQRPIVSSPVVDNGVLYIGSSDRHLYALDLYTGRKIWQYRTEGQISSSPMVYEDAIYFGSTDRYVYSLTSKNGKLRWRFKTGGMVIASPTVDKDVVYIGSTDHHLYAIPA
ncbi:MAG TPA: serine/threonine-protein kinase [candidate division Zixibacteria bacterium]|nr:serine/threonine-protein kinase [candidate division Zixibacteria bacterium]